jgi:holin-like protein
VSPLLAGLTWLLVVQCAGEAVAHATGASVPGPVLGMAILLVALRLRDGRGAAPDAPLGVAADGLARHLSLLFVPAGVGVMLHASRLAHEAGALAAALIGSTVLALATAALTFQWLVRRVDATARDRGP